MKKVLCCLFVLLLLFGCEYEVHDNYIELEKPADEVAVVVELEAANDGESIYLDQRETTVRVNITVGGRRPEMCAFRLGEYTWDIVGGSGSFTINNSWLYDPEYTLTCEMYASTGTGSIAEQAGEEWYMGSYSWPVKVIREGENAEYLAHQVNAEGYFELSWRKFPLNEDVFEGYTIEVASASGTRFATYVSDVNELSHVYKSYAGQQAVFQVSARVKGREEPWRIGRLALDAYTIGMTCDYHRDDSIVVRWDSPYPAAVVTAMGAYEEILKAKTRDREFCVSYPPFGSDDNALVLRLESAFSVDNEQWLMYDYASGGRRSKGVMIAPRGNWARFGYNPVEDVVYVSSYGESTALQCPGFTSLGTYNGSYDSNVLLYGNSQYSSRTIACHAHSVDIFEGKHMRQVVTIPLEVFQVLEGVPTLTKDGKLVVFKSGFGKANVVQFYQAETGALEAETPFPYYMNMEIGITSDGAYLLCQTNGSDIVVVAMNGYAIGETRRLYFPNPVMSWCTSPVDPDDLFVSVGDEIRHYHVRDLSLVNTWKMPDMKIGNIDPKTGNLLVFNSKKMCVIHPKTDKLIHRMDIRIYNELSLYGNILISDTGYALNLEKELQP